MKNLTENNTKYSKKIELGQNNENKELESSDETSSNSSIQESTLSMRTINIQKPKEEIDYETDINDQNLLNKQNEKLIKPCKNGNCYCFTSDSDDFRIAKNKNRSKQNKMRKQEYETQRYNNHQSCNRDSDDVQSFTSLDSSDNSKNKRDMMPSISKRNCIKKGNCEISPNRSLTAKSKTLICGKSKKDVPIIHIIQEFHKNSVISEIRINKSQIQGRQEKNNICKKSSDIKKKIDLVDKISTNDKLQKLENHKNKDAFVNNDIFKEENLIHKNKINLRNAGGKLYEKRIGCESYKHYKDYKSPPKKPPRSISSTSDQFKIESEVDLTSLPKPQHIHDDFSKTNISEYKSNSRNIRKSYPIDNRSKIIDSQYNKMINNNNNISCNSSRFANEKPVKFGWVRPDTEIVQMLESNRKLSELQSLEQKPQAQIGWTIPPKLNIDTVDGISESLPNDSHNFAKNMESKSTPVKSDFSNQTGNSLKEQFKDMITNSIKKDKKRSQNKLESNSSFREKAKVGAKVFLVNSKQKLIEMISGRNDKEIPTKTNVAVQTSADYLNDNINDSFLFNYSLDENNQSTRRFSLQSPHNNKSSKINTTEFDFNRTVNSPKSYRSTQRKLSFSPKKLIKNFSYRPVCIDHPISSDSHYYKSYDNNINKDFTLSSINDILLSIRAKLETSDNHAENTFREISDRENNFKKSFETEEELNKNDDLKNFCKISAQAQVHNNSNPVYSECEEEKLIITGSPSNHSLNEISHYYIDENPYAMIKKVTKSGNNIKNVPSQDLRLNLEGGSEIYQDNSANNKNNINGYNTQPTAPFINDFSVDDELFENGKEVEYESVNDISYNNYNITPNKVTQHESKDESIFVMDQDTVDGLPNSQTQLKVESSFDHVSDKNKLTIQKTDKTEQKSSPVIRNIKQKFRESFNKSKKYLKKEKNIFSSLTKSKDSKKENNNSYRDKNNSTTIWDESDLGIYDLYSETPSISEQLQKTVSLCRKIPYFDSSLEAVEAERLLLYSTLKTEKIKNNIDNLIIQQENRVNEGKIYIDSFTLAISSDINRDIFFNYFYIAVFSYGSRIKSSNFAEKIENTITFRNCNIIFDSLNENSKIKCDIYMLRLRKILNLNTSKNQEQLISKMENLDESYESSGAEFLSRFKLQGCFELNPRNFIPYKIEQSCKIAEIDNVMCLHAKNNITIPLILVGRGTHLKNEICIQAALEILFPKFEIEGFISVQDLKNLHNWNRFWCKLDYFVLKMWKYPQDCLEKDVIYSFDLCKCLNFPIKVIDRSLCARLRSFLLTISNEKDDDNTSYKNIFLSADNQDHLNFWIDGINRILEFVNIWMKIERSN